MPAYACPCSLERRPARHYSVESERRFRAMLPSGDQKTNRSELGCITGRVALFSEKSCLILLVALVVRVLLVGVSNVVGLWFSECQKCQKCQKCQIPLHCCKDYVAGAVSGRGGCKRAVAVKLITFLFHDGAVSSTLLHSRITSYSNGGA